MKIQKILVSAFAAAAVGLAGLTGAGAVATASAAPNDCVNQVTAAGHKVFPQQPCVRQDHKSNGHGHRR